MNITDEDIEYAVLFVFMEGCDFNTAAQALLDMKGIHDPVERDRIFRSENCSGRMSQLWCRLWLVYEYGHPSEILRSTEK